MVSAWIGAQRALLRTGPGIYYNRLPICQSLPIVLEELCCTMVVDASTPHPGLGRYNEIDFTHTKIITLEAGESQKRDQKEVTTFENILTTSITVSSNDWCYPWGSKKSSFALRDHCLTWPLHMLLHHKKQHFKRQQDMERKKPFPPDNSGAHPNLLDSLEYFHFLSIRFAFSQSCRYVKVVFTEMVIRQ
jgi:hypothetical protein